MPEAGKKTIFSGMQPTGFPTLGNYLGAIRNWAKLQDEYNCLYCIVDMHAITVRQDPSRLRATTRDLLALYIAAGLDPEKNIVYIQSHVPAHAELSWILNCFTQVGELNRMTQFKEKSRKNSENVNAGLFDYPVLMAADILLYQADLVPVGDDQKQHIELCRDVAQRFNNIYGDTFTVPEPYINKLGARIMGLQRPESKMSKSETDNVNDAILLLDEPAIIMSKFKRAVTDSEAEVRYDPESKPGVSNLLTIYSLTTGRSIDECVKEFEGRGYGDFKTAVGAAVAEELSAIQRRFEELHGDKSYLETVMKTNAERAGAIAERTLRKVKKRVGFIPRA